MNDSEGEVQLVTLTEFIANERSLELEAAAKLPRKFDRCTYDRGYVRQPLFVCLTCRPSKADLDNELVLI